MRNGLSRTAELATPLLVELAQRHLARLFIDALAAVAIDILGPQQKPFVRSQARARGL